ncbi:P97 family adhesin [Mesomycoplasma dispar]|uniref:P97/LppS family protein n=1 Tax=Mesomycoplasma dispar TaxID=86660 RepID=A0ABM6PQU3_9BACT|nr:hypothetical protein [Mesomycoplasma dispar]ATP59572.1 hypothetical protein CSW10_01230 [Mesomycoplasma dispar]
MKKKNLITVVGTAIFSVAVFATAVGFAANAHYKGVNPRQELEEYVAKVSNLAFKSDVFSPNTTYEQIKSELFENDSVKKDVDLHKYISFYQRINSRISLINNNFSINKPYFKILSLSFDDENQRFIVKFQGFHQIDNNFTATSPIYEQSIAHSQAGQYLLADFNGKFDVLENKLNQELKSMQPKIERINIDKFSYNSEKNTLKAIDFKTPSLIRSVDFADYVNQALDSEEAKNRITEFFPDFSKILNDLNENRSNFLFGNPNNRVYNFTLARDTISKKFITSDGAAKLASFFVKAELTSAAKVNLGKINFSQAPNIRPVLLQKTDKTSFFADEKEILSKINLKEVEFDDYKGAKREDFEIVEPPVSVTNSIKSQQFQDEEQPSLPGAEADSNPKKVPESAEKAKKAQEEYEKKVAVAFKNSLKSTEIIKTNVFDFVNEINSTFHSSNKARSDFIKEKINKLLSRELKLDFSSLDLGKNFKFDGIDFEFDPSEIKISKDKNSDLFEIEIPATISLYDSFFNGNSKEVLTKKTINFKLKGFQPKESLLEKQKELKLPNSDSKIFNFPGKLEPLQNNGDSLVLPSKNRLFSFLNTDFSVKDSSTTSGGTQSSQTGTQNKNIGSIWDTELDSYIKSDKNSEQTGETNTEKLYKILQDPAFYGLDFQKYETILNSWIGKVAVPAENYRGFELDSDLLKHKIMNFNSFDYFKSTFETAAFYSWLARKDIATAAQFLFKFFQNLGVIDQKEVFEYEQILKSNGVFRLAQSIKLTNLDQHLITFNNYFNLSGNDLYSALYLDNETAKHFNSSFADSEFSEKLKKTKSFYGDSASTSSTLSELAKNDKNKVTREFISEYLAKNTVKLSTFKDLLLAFYTKVYQFNLNGFDFINDNLTWKVKFGSKEDSSMPSSGSGQNNKEIDKKINLFYEILDRNGDVLFTTPKVELTLKVLNSKSPEFKKLKQDPVTTKKLNSIVSEIPLGFRNFEVSETSGLTKENAKEKLKTVSLWTKLEDFVKKYNKNGYEYEPTVVNLENDPFNKENKILTIAVSEVKKPENQVSTIQSEPTESSSESPVSQNSWEIKSKNVSLFDSTEEDPVDSLSGRATDGEITAPGTGLAIDQPPRSTIFLTILIIKSEKGEKIS